MRVDRRSARRCPDRCGGESARGRGAPARDRPPASGTEPDALSRARIANETAQARYYEHQVAKPADTGTPVWLPTLLGGLLAIGGGMLSTFLANRNGEGKAQREQRRTYDRQRGQLRLALDDLRAALDPIVASDAPPAFLSEALLYRKPARPALADRVDEYYRKYDLVDTIYRFCAVLGWIELYRCDPSFLRGTDAENRRLAACFEGIRSALADDFVDEKRAAGSAHDGFILDDDQRAIGEKMMASRRADVVIGYAAFCERLFRDPRADDPTGAGYDTSQNWWIWNATRFFVEFGGSPAGTDFRLQRLRKVAARLDDAMAATGAES